MTGLILAGGRSARMGTPKALLRFGGEPLIRQVVRRLQPLFRELVVVAAPAQELPTMPARIVRDAQAYQGPVAGIFYGLQAIGGDAAFVMSCDSPFARTELIEHLIGVEGGYDAIVPRWGGQLQPLFAVYRASVSARLTACLAAGELRLTTVVDGLNARVVEEPEVRRFDPDGSSFVNVNTPDDYESALKRWDAG